MEAAGMPSALRAHSRSCWAMGEAAGRREPGGEPARAGTPAIDQIHR
jgi:hypothetical protein